MSAEERLTRENEMLKSELKFWRAQVTAVNVDLQKALKKIESLGGVPVV